MLKDSIKDYGSNNNRSQLKRKRDEEESNQPVVSEKFIHDVSQKSNAAM